MILLHIKFTLMMSKKKEEVRNPTKETKTVIIYEFKVLIIYFLKLNYQNIKSMKSQIIQIFIKNKLI